MRTVVVSVVWVAVMAGIVAGADASFQVQGFVYCLDEKGAATFGPDGEPCAAQGHRYAFNTLEGKLYPLVRGDVGESLFVDRRLHERTLLLTLLASRTPGAFEVLVVQSVVSGVVHDVYYFCDVCNIRDFAPGPCDCCREPYQFIEQPAPTRQVGQASSLSAFLGEVPGRSDNGYEHGHVHEYVNDHDHVLTPDPDPWPLTPAFCAIVLCCRTSAGVAKRNGRFESLY